MRRDRGGAAAPPGSGLDLYNRVHESSNLTHQNVLSLMETAFTKAHGEDYDYCAVSGSGAVDACVINDTPGLIDYNLGDAILKFISSDEHDRASFALCIGHLDHRGRIGGNTHWTALHLRKVSNPDGSGTNIVPYYADSMGAPVPAAVTRVLNEVFRKGSNLDSVTSKEFRGTDVCRNAAGRLKGGRYSFQTPQIVECPRQTDGFSCGYHAVFNMARMDAAVDPSNINLGTRLPQWEKGVTVENLNVEAFIVNRRKDLEGEFNFPVLAVGGGL